VGFDLALWSVLGGIRRVGMSKWANYGISAVRYDRSHSRIAKLRIHRDDGEQIGSALSSTRQEVVDLIQTGFSFVTILEDSDGNWTKGQPVEIVEIGGVEFLKTESNDSEGDNLENLPEF